MSMCFTKHIQCLTQPFLVEFLLSKDKSQKSPWQALSATDLHGKEWHFRHIFSGQPRRHVLTTGWSDFVSAKKLVAGDVLIFLRGENGELRVGVRRLKSQPNKMSPLVISSQSLWTGVLQTACHATDSWSTFPVCYRPSTNQSKFIVSVNKYIEARNHKFSVNMRFTKTFEDGRRFSGTIVGIGGNPSSRWPHSEWRSLKVQWDEPSNISYSDWVSSWEIEPIVQDTAPKCQTPQTNEQASSPFLMLPMEDLSRPESFTATETNNPSGNEKSHLPPVSTESIRSNQLDTAMESIAPVTEQGQHSGFRLFGVELFDHSTNKIPSIGMSDAGVVEQPLSQSCIEVHMDGRAVGGAVDLARLNGYVDLLKKLEKIFEIEGELFGKKWQVAYLDEENDMMMLGDYPWHEFCGMVKVIYILPNWIKHLPDEQSSNRK